MDKRKKKEALAILLILLVGVFAYNYGKRGKQSNLSLPTIGNDGLKDSVANNSAHVGKGINAGLSLPNSDDGQLKDSVAQSPAFETPRGNGGEPPAPPPPAPRGIGEGGINAGGPNPGGQLPHNPPSNVSTSGPSQPQ